ncbi:MULTISPECIES: type II secretion system protein N [Pseudomonas]|jgi:general secretion pathway protein C|uniref:General secretion pathway protein GspC n=1 Tax=Pseudomonas frederiksbergensis TaxID=104087 RepID=A0A0B1Z6Z3_9PSED|nr:MULTISPECIES: type II secretion system protein N [Pseudomonas]KHK66375.1 general secretion pathway protein GspC [Pseudomonas frederiksbergensis]KJH86130.1 general secretion pathway protein GspC [Pseudomonas fluorescens]MBI6619154.1 general secretion pathway protein GspC [Pseudomonas corrugata]MBI6693126.1 general secretion pathway protein GspC [Pseudomonas corrugata]WRV70890.1 type II secretion system protein N [Pseudomonas frederiksbergensis]
MAFTERVSPAQIVQALGLAAALAGVATWSSLLLTSAESRTPDVTPQRMAERSDNPALQWFSSQPAAVDIKVTGVLAGARGAVAILSLNDGPPRSFLVGERVAQGVRLVSIEAQAVVIEQGSEQTRLAIARLPDSVSLPSLTR